MASLDEMDPTGLQGDRLRSFRGIARAFGRFETRLKEALRAHDSATHTLRVQVQDQKVVKITLLVDEQIPVIIALDDLTQDDEGG